MNKAGLKGVASKLAEEIAKEAGRWAVVIALEGPLGAGKTTFTKFLAKELKIKDEIVSPTFVLHRPYKGLNHIDCYRMETFEELGQIGLQKMIEDKSVIAIEWADRFKPQVTILKSQAKLIWVKIDYGIKDNERRISYEDFGG